MVNSGTRKTPPASPARPGSWLLQASEAATSPRPWRLSSPPSTVERTQSASPLAPPTSTPRSPASPTMTPLLLPARLTSAPLRQTQVEGRLAWLPRPSSPHQRLPSQWCKPRPRTTSAPTLLPPSTSLRRWRPRTSVACPPRPTSGPSPRVEVPLRLTAPPHRRTERLMLQD